MIKRISIILMTFITTLLYNVYFAPLVFAADDTPIIIINGMPVETADAMPFMEQNEIMVPLKNVAEAMGFRSDNWTAYSVWVYDDIYNTQPLIVDMISSSPNRMYFGGGAGKSLDNSVPPMRIGDIVYVPLRPFADAFDYIVQWDENAKTATLISELDTPFFADKEVNTTHSLLNDRLIISMPENAENKNAWYGGIMGAATDTEYEVNLNISGNSQTLTVNVSELYLYSTGDIQKDASLLIDIINAEHDEYSEYSEPVIFDLSEPVKIDDIEFVIMQPIPVKSNYSNEYFIMSALVRVSDNTLMFVRVYADTKAMMYPEDCTNIAWQIVNSIKGGTRSLIVDGQKLDMGDYTIQVAPGYVPKFNLGVDFDVWYFNKLVTIGDISSSFGIYRGGHPSYDNEKKPTKTARDIVLSRIVKWRIHTEASGKFDENSYAETILLTYISLEFPYYYAEYMHIFASPSSESDWKAIREMVRSLRDINGTATLIIWVLYGIILVIVAVITLVILLIVRKRRKVKRLANEKNTSLCD